MAPPKRCCDADASNVETLSKRMRKVVFDKPPTMAQLRAKRIEAGVRLHSLSPAEVTGALSSRVAFQAAAPMEAPGPEVVLPLYASCQTHAGTHDATPAHMLGLVQAAVKLAAVAPQVELRRFVRLVKPGYAYGDIQARWKATPCCPIVRVDLSSLPRHKRCEVTRPERHLPRALVVALVNTNHCSQRRGSKLLLQGCLRELKRASYQTWVSPRSRQEAMQKEARYLLGLVQASAAPGSGWEGVKQLLLGSIQSLRVWAVYLGLRIKLHRQGEDHAGSYGVSAGEDTDLHVVACAEGFSGVVVSHRDQAPVCCQAARAAATHMAGTPYCDHDPPTAAAGAGAEEPAGEPILGGRGPLRQVEDELRELLLGSTTLQSAVMAMLLVEQLAKCSAVQGGEEDQVWYRGGGVAAPSVEDLAHRFCSSAPTMPNGTKVVTVIVDHEWCDNPVQKRPKYTHSTAMACGLTAKAWGVWRIAPPTALEDAAHPKHPEGVEPVQLNAFRRMLLDLFKQLLGLGCELVLVGWGRDDWDALTYDPPPELAGLKDIAFVDLSRHPQLVTVEESGKVHNKTMSLDAAMELLTGVDPKPWREVHAFDRRHSAVVDVICTSFVLRCLVRDHQVRARVVAALAAGLGASKQTEAGH